MPEDPGASPAKVILVSADLLARARVNAAAAKAGLEVVVVAPRADLTSHRADLLVVDLDAVDPATLTATADQIVGYYSHIEPAKAEQARRAGCRAVPRGRFWREVLDLFLSLAQTR